MRTNLAIGLVLISSALLASASAAAPDLEAPQVLIERMEKSARTQDANGRLTGLLYYGAEVGALLDQRDAASVPIMAAVDQAEKIKGAPPAYTARLYWLLGVIKDPVTIPWLEASWNGPRAFAIRNAWLTEWRDSSGDTFAAINSAIRSKWNQNDDAWCEFFLRVLSKETTTKGRCEILGHIRGCFSSIRFVQAVTDLRSRAREFEEIIEYDACLRAVGVILHDDVLKNAIKNSHPSCEQLARAADTLRDECFLRPLIDCLDTDSTAPQCVGNALAVLTMRLDLSDQNRNAWESWRDENGNLPRSAWIRSSLTRILEIDRPHRMIPLQRFANAAAGDAVAAPILAEFISALPDPEVGDVAEEILDCEIISSRSGSLIQFGGQPDRLAKLCARDLSAVTHARLAKILNEYPAWSDFAYWVYRP